MLFFFSLINFSEKQLKSIHKGRGSIFFHRYVHIFTEKLENLPCDLFKTSSKTCMCKTSLPYLIFFLQFGDKKGAIQNSNLSYLIQQIGDLLCLYIQTVLLIIYWNKIIIVYWEIFALFSFSLILHLLSAGEFKTRRIPVPQIILFKQSCDWANSGRGETFCRWRWVQKHGRKWQSIQFPTILPWICFV